MKKSLSIILLLQLSLYSYSQTTTFNKTFAPYPNNPNAPFVLTSIAAMGNSYVASGGGFDTVNSNLQSLFFYKIDTIGNVSKIRSFTRNGWNYYYNISSLIELKNGGYCYIGEMDTFNHNPEHFLIRFDYNMDTLWTKIIPNDSVYWESLNQVKETSDKELIFVGSKQYTANDLGVLLVKTDSSGNVLWKKTITCQGNGASHIFETPDKGFILKGFRESALLGDGGPFILKTDSAGNQEWLKYLGGNEYDGSASIAITKDNNILVAYGYSTYTYFFNENWTAHLNVIKFSPNGNIIWSKFYDTLKLDLDVTKIQVLPNDDFIVMGLESDKGYDNYFYSFMFKFNANGDSLWKKKYYIKNNVGDQNLLVDNLLNADRSITACGWVSSDTQVPYQQIWILKTDSTGYAPGPQNYVGIIDLPYLQIGYGGLRVYPNPATTQATISYPTAEKDIMLQLYNTLGQLIYEEKLPKGSSQTTLDTRTYKKGLYKVVVGESSASLIING